MGTETNLQIARIWSPACGRPLTEDDGAEIARNLVGFFTLLAEWADQDEGLGGPAGGVTAPRS